MDKEGKRFMVDFMHAQGKVIVHPNLPGHKALAKALQTDGEHGMTRENSKDNPYVVELVNLDEWLHRDWESQLSSQKDLMDFGLDH